MWALLLAIACADEGRVAVTIDDLPGHHWAGIDPGVGTARILAALAAHHVPATGFVNCDNGGEDVLRMWLDAGHELGNHHATHGGLNKVPPDEWLTGVDRCQAALQALTGTAPRFFRYPYLFNGPTPEIREHVRAAIESKGLTIARVTVDDHEWKLAELYDSARLAGDAAEAERIAALYVPHVIAAIRHFRDVSKKKVGRDVAHVLLLHDNGLAADHLGELLAAIEAEGLRFVPLAEAAADPVYALPNAYDGKWGISWLYRIPPAADDGWLGQEWERLFGE